MLAVHLNYSITDLDELINVTSLSLPSHVTSHTFFSIAPGRSYVATVAFENEVGLSQNNPLGEFSEAFVNDCRGYFRGMHDKPWPVHNSSDTRAYVVSVASSLVHNSDTGAYVASVA